MKRSVDSRLDVLERQVGMQTQTVKRSHDHWGKPGESFEAYCSRLSLTTCEDFLNNMADHNPEGANELRGLFATAQGRKRLLEIEGGPGPGQ